MQSRKPSKRSSSTNMPAVTAGSISERRPNGMIASKMYGHITGPIVVQMHREILTLIQGDTPKFWLVDTTAVTSFDTLGLPEPAGIFLKDLKDRGFTVVGIITSAPVRMMGSTLCFGAGIRHKFFDSAREAERCVSTFLSEGANP